jgi:hypothetical protein
MARYSATEAKSDVTKFGGSGDVGDPQPLDDLGITWQPRLQGNMGYLDSKYESGSGLLAGDTSKVTMSAIEFGGGARFRFGDSFSVAPTLMGLYGHTSDDYEVRSAFMRANLIPATQLVDNKIDLDMPLGIQLFGHELHTGGYLSRTELLGDLKDGLGVAHMNEVHGRLVLDVLHQLWKVQWIGLGASYIDGTNISGWTVGVDVAFRF